MFLFSQAWRERISKDFKSHNDSAAWLFSPASRLNCWLWEDLPKSKQLFSIQAEPLEQLSQSADLCDEAPNRMWLPKFWHRAKRWNPCTLLAVLLVNASFASLVICMTAVYVLLIRSTMSANEVFHPKVGLPGARYKPSSELDGYQFAWRLLMWLINGFVFAFIGIPPMPATAVALGMTATSYLIFWLLTTTVSAVGIAGLVDVLRDDAALPRSAAEHRLKPSTWDLRQWKRLRYLLRVIASFALFSTLLTQVFLLEPVVFGWNIFNFTASCGALWSGIVSPIHLFGWLVSPQLINVTFFCFLCLGSVYLVLGLTKMVGLWWRSHLLEKEMLGQDIDTVEAESILRKNHPKQFWCAKALVNFSDALSCYFLPLIPMVGLSVVFGEMMVAARGADVVS